MPADIHAFFDSYRDAFNRLDGRAVSAHYDCPAMIIHADGAGVFTDAGALDTNNIALCARYEKDGFMRADFTERACLTLGEQFCLVDLAWTIARKEQTPQLFNTAYSLAKRDGHWKVAAVTAYEERRPGKRP
jgi:hypothetical protein